MWSACLLVFLFPDDIKRLPSIQQAAWHEDKEHSLLVLLCSNGECVKSVNADSPRQSTGK